MPPKGAATSTAVAAAGGGGARKASTLRSIQETLIKLTEGAAAEWSKVCMRVLLVCPSRDTMQWPQHMMGSLSWRVKRKRLSHRRHGDVETNTGHKYVMCS